MFRTREPQDSLWQSEFLITPRKARLMRRSWAQVFRKEALPLIDEERFAAMYSADMGRPNRAVQTVLGVLVLKEMFDLTDIEALEELEMEEAHLAQKTLHNFRVRLMEHDGGRLAFCETTDRMIEALGLRTGKQRVDSTHIMSNIAVLTRLGLFCETIRVFLLAVSREHPGLGEGIGYGLAQRYLRETGRSIPIRGRAFGRGASPAVGVRARRVPAGRSVPRDGGGADGRVRAVGATVARAVPRGSSQGRSSRSG